MNELNQIVEKSLKKHIGLSIKKLNLKIASSLENRLTSNIFLNLKFDTAKRDFQKKYFTEILTFSLGNISKASILANLERRHVHRICKELKINVDDIRKEMIKPRNYLIKTFSDIIEEKIDEFSNTKDLIDINYENIPIISRNLIEEIDTNLPSYQEALQIFEKIYFNKVLKKASFNITKAAQLAGISQRSIFRKIKSLSLET